MAGHTWRAWAVLALPVLVAFAAEAGDAAPGKVVLPKIEMPPGITIYETQQGPVFATDKGMTIYKKLPKVGTWALAAGQADANGTCAYQCASEWPPVTAPVDAKPVGDFTILTSEQGVRQWAYKGVPLETFKYDHEPGDTLGEDTYSFNGPRRPFGEAAWIEAENPLAEPPALPEPSHEIPPGISVQKVALGNRVFATVEGFTLYTRNDASKKACGSTCIAGRTAIPAPSFAHAVGDWAPVEDTSGVRAWAYKGQVVYSYSGDREAHAVEGEANGWHPAFEYLAPMPPEVAVGATEGGLVYVGKASQRTLYYEGFAPRPYEYLGFNHPKYRFGTVNCYDACAKAFPPLLAAVDDKPVGEWWIVTRLDGARQWAYRGVPTYMYADDEPGRQLASYRGHKWAVLKAD